MSAPSGTDNENLKRRREDFLVLFPSSKNYPLPTEQKDGRDDDPLEKILKDTEDLSLETKEKHFRIDKNEVESHLKMIKGLLSPSQQAQELILLEEILKRIDYYVREIECYLTDRNLDLKE